MVLTVCIERGTGSPESQKLHVQAHKSVATRAAGAGGQQLPLTQEAAVCHWPACQLAAGLRDLHNCDTRCLRCAIRVNLNCVLLVLFNVLLLRTVVHARRKAQRGEVDGVGLQEAATHVKERGGGKLIPAHAPWWT